MNYRQGLIVTIAVIVSSSEATAATIAVYLNGGADYADIQSAIDAAKDGDTVLVKPGEYTITEPIDFNRLYDPDDPANPPLKNIAVKSEGGAVSTTIRMSETPADPHRASVVIFENGEAITSVLEGFTITGGNGAWDSAHLNLVGGGVSCFTNSSPTLKDCTISGNAAEEAGGVYCYYNSSPVLTNCTISRNSARFHSGGVYCEWSSSPTLTNCAIKGNSADYGGGVYCYNNSSPTLTNCTISGNSAEYAGGVCCYESSPILTSCIVWDNAGGSLVVEDPCQPKISFSCLETEGIWPGEGNIDSDPLFCGFVGSRDVYVDTGSAGSGDGSVGSPFLELSPGLEYRLSLEADSPCIGAGADGTNMGVDGGTCESGGARERVVHLAPGRYSLEAMTLAHGASIIGEGAEEVVLEGTVRGLRTGSRLSRVTVIASTYDGIVIACGESPTIEDCTISGKSARYYGVGVYCGRNSSPILTNCTISGNLSGGVHCDNGSSPILENCTISGNEGGGIHCFFSSATLTSCTISGNSAAWDDGGGVLCSGGSPNLTNCTISGNSTYGDGGGVHCSESSPTLTSCTISGNQALYGSGGGVYCDDSDFSPNFKNCTISGNSAAYFGGMGGALPTLTNCIVWDNLCGSVSADGLGNSTITYSCIEEQSVWAGEGNINADPLFCGWGERHEVWIDPSWGAPGDGSEGNPFSDPRQATRGFSLALSTSSPCRGSGIGGSDMGSDNGRCDGPAGRNRIVHLAAGTYKAEDFDLVHHVSLQGSGEDRTVIEGTVQELRTGSSISSMTITKGEDRGTIRVDAYESPQVIDCTISGFIGCFGGGVYCGPRSSPVLVRCTVVGNRVEGIGCQYHLGGGVVCVQGSSPRLEACTISWNSGSTDGAGLLCDTSSPILTNCTISGNWSVGAWCRTNSYPTLTNCTISGNAGVGMVCWDTSCPTLTNCILWGNANELVCLDERSVPVVSYSCIEQTDLWPGEGNVNGNPLFVRSGRWEDCGGAGQPGCMPYGWNPVSGEETAWHRWIQGDYQLQPGSPCIDAGILEGAPTIDLEGHGRPCGNGVEMGAHEFGDCPASTVRFVRGNVDGKGGIDISDPIFLLTFLFVGGKAPDCLDAGDINDDWVLDISDAVYSLTFQFLGGDPPESPYPECGIERWINGLTCENFPACVSEK